MKFFRVKRKSSESRTLCWAIAINRKNKDGTLWMPSTFSLICGKHFIGGKPVDDKNDPDFIPSIFPSPEQSNSNEFFQSRISAIKELKNLVSKIELKTDQEKKHIKPKIKSVRKRKSPNVIARGEFESNAFEEKLQEPKNKKHKKHKKQCTNVCHVCAKSMKGQTRIDRHIFYDHDNSPRSDHQCETCTAYFFNKTDLMVHNKGRK